MRFLLNHLNNGKQKPCPFFFKAAVTHMEVPRLGVESELQLLAYATATATQDRNLSMTYTTAYGNDGTPHPLSKARNRTRIFVGFVSAVL